jgi:hypothetical protein
MAKPKPKQPKGSKQLCAALNFIVNANLDIAADAADAGNTKEAKEALEVVQSAVNDQKKWGCAGGETARMSRARKRIASLKRALGRGRRPGRAIGRPR